jgi:hypothetical protein
MGAVEKTGPGRIDAMKINETQLRRLVRQERRHLQETRDLSQINTGRFIAMLDDVYMNASNTGNFPPDLEAVAAWLGVNTGDLFNTVNRNRNSVLDQHPWLEDMMEEYRNGAY